MQTLLQSLARSASVDWIDLRFHRRRVRRIGVRMGQLAEAQANVFSGVGIRVLDGGGWGFAATADLTEPGLRRALDNAIRSARALGAARKSPLTVDKLGHGPRPFSAPPAPARPDFEQMLQIGRAHV